MQIVYLSDTMDAEPEWAAYLPNDCALLRLSAPQRADGAFFTAPSGHHALSAAVFGAIGGDIPANSELIIMSLRGPTCLGSWLSILRSGAGDCPIIAISDMSAEYQKSLLRAGLDAVLPPQMPADVLAAQLVAFVRLRRKYHPVARHGLVQFYSHAKRALVAERDLQLTAREYDILHFIAQANGRPVGAAELLRIIFGLNFDPGTNIAAVHIYRLRKKLADLGFAHLLQTVQGRGYRLALM